MGLRFVSIASGSSGNCYAVFSDTTALLVDAGISGKRIMEGLEKTCIPAAAVAALLVTHEHDDHVRSLRVMGKKIPGMRFYASSGTWLAIEDKVSPERRESFRPGDSFTIGDIDISTFSVSHDAAEPVGYCFECGGRRAVIVTDTGYVPEHIYPIAAAADLIVMESNHEVGMLDMNERYPYQLKRRIKGDCGHLSNSTAADFLCSLAARDCRPRQILLAHLSKENNFPEAALQVTCNALEEAGHPVCQQLKVEVLSRSQVSREYLV